MKTNLTAFLGGIALVMIATTGIATAQPYGPGSGYGPGNGRGPGMAWGYGSGMMGSGYGAGMMRGCGGAYGSDRMLAALSLTDDQRGKTDRAGHAQQELPKEFENRPQDASPVADG